MKKHTMRLVDYFLHYFHIGERCGCVISGSEEVWRIKGIKSLFWPWTGTGTGCRQRSFKNGNNKTMNVYASMVFLCEHCNKYHKKDNDNYMEGHRKALENLDSKTREAFECGKQRFEHIV